MNGDFYSIDNQNDKLYFDILLSKNIGKKIIVHLNHNKDISGILENIGADYLILSEPSTGNKHIILPIYISYITFEEEINS